MLSPTLAISTTAEIADNLTSSISMAPNSCENRKKALAKTRTAAGSDCRKIRARKKVTTADPTKAMQISVSRLKYCAQYRNGMPEG